MRRFVTGSWLDKSQAALLVSAAGLGPGWEELPDVNGGRYGEMKPEYAHDFHLAADFPIAGRVVDARGNPVAGAVVAVRSIYDLADPRWWKMHPAIKANDTKLMSREEADPNNWFTPLYRTAWDLQSADAAKADRAIWTLVAAGNRAAAYLDARLKPIQENPLKRIPQLLVDLDSNQFGTREAASKELQDLLPEGEECLQTALGRNPSVEVRLRLGQLLERNKSKIPGPEGLRRIRVLEVLEHIATPEARNLLKKLAGGDPHAPLTQEAKAVMERLQR